MANKKILGRVLHKSDTSANWAAATTFIPLAGEVIIYSDLNKIKVGDGATTVSNLPFVKALPVVGKSNYTMAATSWSSGTYSFEDYYPNTTYNVEIELAPTATTELAKAYGKAIITGNASTNVVKALGTVPTVDIPIIITYLEK